MSGAIERGSLFAAILGVALSLSACAGATPRPRMAEQTPQLSCDDSIAAHFKPNAETRVLLVKAFKQGDAFPNVTADRYYEPTATLAAAADLCLVKLLVGPGHPGPAGAPSTSAGIGIEVWLPSKTAWNGRVHAVGGGGWAGTAESDPTKISAITPTSDGRSAPLVAGQEGAVTASTDTGHAAPLSLGGSFAMNPDGTINTTLWNDFASRAIHQEVVMAKALATAYYGVAPKYTYWEGASLGGRQAMKQAQRYPNDFDGIISGFPAINWTKFGVGGAVYPQIVVQQDLGGRYMTADQLNLVSNAAIAACDTVDGKHLGFILDPSTCRYDPVKDTAVLCATDGGSNQTAACVTPKQALAINKFWYGMTTDGSVPDPAIDNGSGPLSGKHKWYGLTRGTSLLTLASQSPFPIATDMLALILQDPRIATPSFRNAKANGADGWKSISYQQLAQAFEAGIALQPQFADINTDDPDLTAFKAHGGKLIQMHGTADGIIPYGGSVDYYRRVVAKMGGPAAVESFYRFYPIPGMAHGPANGTSNPAANPPILRAHKAEIYTLLADWVEKGVAPGRVVLRSASDAPVANSLPLCAYPKKITFVGGDIHMAGSYDCR